MLTQETSFRTRIDRQREQLAAHPSCHGVLCDMASPLEPGDHAQWCDRLRLPEAARALYAEVDGFRIAWEMDSGPLAGINSGMTWLPLEQIALDRYEPDVQEELESMSWDSDEPDAFMARISRRHLFEEAHVYEDAARKLEGRARVWFEINGSEHVLYYMFEREFIELELDFERYIECAIAVMGYPFWQLLFARDASQAARRGVSRAQIVELFPEADALLL